MDLVYTYLKIKKIAKTIKEKYKISSMVEIVQYVFSDEDILTLFVRVGADCKDNKEADELINQAMIDGLDYFEIQQRVIEALIDANFYRKELQEMLKTLEVQTTPEQN